MCLAGNNEAVRKCLLFQRIDNEQSIGARFHQIQQKTEKPVQFELMPEVRFSLRAWLERGGGKGAGFAFPSQADRLWPFDEIANAIRFLCTDLPAWPLALIGRCFLHGGDAKGFSTLPVMKVDIDRTCPVQAYDRGHDEQNACCRSCGGSRRRRCITGRSQRRLRTGLSSRRLWSLRDQFCPAPGRAGATRSSGRGILYRPWVLGRTPILATSLPLAWWMALSLSVSSI